MRVAVVHKTRLDYSAEVVEGVMDVRLGPLSDVHQRWDQFDVRVTPAASVRRYGDGAGNVAHLISIPKPHRFVEIVTRSEVTTLLDDPFQVPATPPRPLSPAERFEYLSPSPLVTADADLVALAAPYRLASDTSVLDTVQSLMRYVYEGFTYQPQVTNVSTTVSEALAARAGVCQDFAHVLIGLCRAIDVPARYVSGYIVTARPRSQSQTLGTMMQSQSLSVGPTRGGGASHAWVEAFTPTHGWRGFDPTNGILASESHVKMAIGRDYGDVPPTRGTFRGAAREQLVVEVVAEQHD